MSLFLYGGIVAILFILILGVEIMAIGTAIQNSGFVRVYDEKGHPIYSIPGDSYGFTSTTVSIKVVSFIHIYDAKGHPITSKPL